MGFRFWRRAPQVYGLSGVGANLTARHVPPHQIGEVHDHVWEFTAWFRDEGHDALPFQHALKVELEPYQGKILPQHLSRAEAMAKWFCARLDGCVRVEVRRDDEKLYARWPWW